ncbi:hypothetical protein EV383_1446 [Pseudonocardia sediminis]|uniref:Acetyltransferase (GNAT) family protein n=2 Tax=Pseudonocardia sediminis TaxID=1397368 RepID=A0A4Q7UWW9_PSEST|nr:hypothetical protein EV383_1446 [Pseudonocardia sediminis]
MARLFAEDSGRRDPHADVGWPAVAGGPHVTDALRSSDALVVVADDGSVRGYLLARRAPANPLRPGLVVADLESMYDAFTSWAASIPANVLSVTAHAANDGARRLYRRRGFVEHSITLECPSRAGPGPD